MAGRAPSRPVGSYEVVPTLYEVDGTYRQRRTYRKRGTVGGAHVLAAGADDLECRARAPSAIRHAKSTCIHGVFVEGKCVGGGRDGHSVTVGVGNANVSCERLVDLCSISDSILSESPLKPVIVVTSNCGVCDDDGWPRGRRRDVGFLVPN